MEINAKQFLQFLIVQYYLWTVINCCLFTCICKWKNGKQTVDCVNRGLLKIPNGIDSGTQVLMFSGNNISYLGPECFLSIELVNLQKIYLSKCHIATIDSSSFKGLKNLVELDLSENRLTNIPSDIFVDVPLLMKLIISWNPIRHLNSYAFKYLIYLTILDLSYCELTDIERETFSGLDSLENLKLNNNKLKSVPGINTLPITLHGIDLSNNHWLCDCDLVDFHQWLILYKVPQMFEPKCHLPVRLINHEIHTVSKDEFACLPEVSPTALYLEIGEGKNISLNCKVISKPQAKITWWFQGRQLMLQDNDNNADVMFSVDEKLQSVSEKISELAIYNLSVDDSNGTFNCVAENSAGKSQANFTIRILVHDDPTVVIVTFPYESVLVAIIGAIILVFSMVIILICLFIKCFKRTRRKCQKINKSHLMNSNSSIKCTTLTSRDSDNDRKVDSPEQQIQNMIMNATPNSMSINLQRFEKETFSPNKQLIVSNIDVYNTSTSTHEQINPDLINDTTENSIMNTNNDVNAIDSNSKNRLIDKNCDFYTRTSTYFLDNEGYPLDYGLPHIQLPVYTKNIVPNNQYYRTLPYKRKISNGTLLRGTQSRDMEFYDLDKKPSVLVADTRPYYCSTNVRYTANGYPELNQPSYHSNKSQVFMTGNHVLSESERQSIKTKQNLPLFQVPCCNIPMCYSKTNSYNQPQAIDTKRDRNSPNVEQTNKRCINLTNIDSAYEQQSQHHCHHHCHQRPSLMLVNGIRVSDSPDEGYVGDSIEI